MTTDRLRRNLFILSATIVLTSIGSGNCFAAGEGEVCGGYAGIPCDIGFMCNYIFPGGAGRCRRVRCQNYDPVRGCDYRTYRDDYERRGAEAAKSHDGR
jgi:hypothetical protein